MLSLVVFQYVKDIKKARLKFHRVSNKLLLKNGEGFPSPRKSHGHECLILR